MAPAMLPSATTAPCISPIAATTACGRSIQHGKISTFAGNGLYAFYQLVDGSIASQTELCDPIAVAAGADGSMYIASYECSEVYRVGADGRIARVAGNSSYGSGLSGDRGRATSAKLNHPTDIALGPDGSLYIADTDNHRSGGLAPTAS